MITKSTQTSSPTSDTPQQPANKKFKIAIIIMAVMLVIAFALSAFVFIKYHNLKSQLKDRQTKLVLRTFKKVDVNNQPTSFATPIKEGEDGYLNFNKLLDSKWFGETVLDYFKANKETLKVGFDNFGMLSTINGLSSKTEPTSPPTWGIFWEVKANTTGTSVGLGDIFLVDFVNIDFTYTKWAS